MKTLHRTLLAASLVAALGAGAIAQTQPTPAPTAPAAQSMRQQDPAKMEQFRARMQERMAKRLGDLKQTLQVTSAQEGAWTAWTAALQPGNFQRPDRAAFRSMTTPERIDQMRSLRAERNAQMDKRMDATRTFYAALSAEQKKVFDEEGLRFMGGKRGHRGGFHRHG